MQVGMLGFSDIHNNSHGLSRNSDLEGESDGPGEGLTSDCHKSGLSSPIFSSKTTLGKNRNLFMRPGLVFVESVFYGEETWPRHKVLGRSPARSAEVMSVGDKIMRNARNCITDILARFLYNALFSEDERQEIKSIIQSNLYRKIRFTHVIRQPYIVQAHIFVIINQICEETINSISQRLRAFSDWLHQWWNCGRLKPFKPHTAGKSSAFLRRQLFFISGFIWRAVEISRADYEPSDLDILGNERVRYPNFQTPTTSEIMESYSVILPSNDHPEHFRVDTSG
ncbi:hypothetical protein POM88_049767 [Heracleum sosnowskyi]|uniref:Uncharacterized protein n=1 Tax=Heracleum sosnowskyi TaxID=360622 RepID=A0AAD8GXH2_9APIA|nr:hypothetical protein POM88_049767 [Heracleum sosnowskyi]